MKRTLVLGLGNPILRDDSVGLRVAEAIAAKMTGREDVVVEQDTWGGLRLMEHMIGFDRAIIIDAIQTHSHPPGTLHRLHPDDMPTQRSASAHDVNLATALAFGRQAGARLPQDEQILLIGIEAADVQTFDEALSPDLERALPRAIEATIEALSKEDQQP